MGDRNANTARRTPKKEVLSPKVSITPTRSAEHLAEVAEMGMIVQFLIKRILEMPEPLKRSGFSAKIWQEYKELIGSTKNAAEIGEIFNKNSATLRDHCSDLDMVLKMHFVYRIPLDAAFLESLKLNAELLTDENSEVLYYFANREKGLILYDASDDSRDRLEPPTTDSDEFDVDELGDSDTEDRKFDVSLVRPTRQRFTADEELEMWYFLLAQVYNPATAKPEKHRVLSKGLAIWEEFRKVRKSTRAAQTLCCKFRRQMAPNLHDAASLSNEQKLILYYALDIPLEENFLIRLRASGTVCIDDYGCVTMYRRHKTPIKDESQSPEYVLEQLGEEEDVAEVQKKKKQKKRQIDSDEDEDAQPAKTPRLRRSNRIQVPLEFQRLLEEQTGIPSSQFVALKRVRLSETVEKEKSLTPSDTDTSGHSRKTVPPVDNRSTKNFLIQLTHLVRNLDMPQLDDNLQKIKERIKESPDTEELSVDRIKVILDATLAMIPN